MSDNFLLLSLPSSGTDWLCGILANHASSLRYYDKEFFNPICNPKYQDALAASFGCEMVSHYENIAIDPVYQPNIGTLIDRTWGRESYTFNKENFSAFKVAAFHERFRCAMLYRSAEQSFPPSRLRVYAWYDAIWNSLRQRGMVAETKSLDERAREAHAVCWDRLWADAKRFAIPVLRYEVLVSGDRDEVRRELDCGWMTDVLDLDGAADAVMDSRRTRLQTTGQG